MNKLKARIFNTGQMPWRNRREPVKIRTKPLTGERMNKETKNVSATEIVPVIMNTTTQLGRLYSFLRIPSIA